MKYLLTFNEKSDFIYEYEDIDYDFIVESKNEIEYRGELFPGYNKPKRYKGAGKYKFRVLAKDDDKIKIVNFGHSDYEDYTQHKDKDRRSSFRKRHKCDPVKNLDKTTARYWACQYLW
jgi:hypothetical protein